MNGSQDTSVNDPSGQNAQNRHTNGPRMPAVILTRDVSGMMSGQGIDGTTGAAQNGALGPTVTKALQDVLGWKFTAGDSKGFVSALNRSFELTEFEGHVRSKWIPQGVAVQDDLAGGIAGAQASLYAMAKTVLDQTLPLLSGLRTLRPDADDAYVTVVRQLVQSQLTELVNELGFQGGPRVVRVDQYFHMLMGVHIDGNGTEAASDGDIPNDPDHVRGTLGSMRDEMGLRTTPQARFRSYINTVEDEQNVTNFRVIVDYVGAILNSWLNSAHFFATLKTPFLGTQLVWISRQLGVVSEAVDEIRFLLDANLVGPAERETMWLYNLTFTQRDGSQGTLPDISLEALLSWIQTFVRKEAPDIIRNGGRLGIGVDIERMIHQLSHYARALVVHSQGDADFRLNNERVRPALRKLAAQLHELARMAAPVGIKRPPDLPGLPKLLDKPDGTQSQDTAETTPAQDQAAAAKPRVKPVAAKVRAKPATQAKPATRAKRGGRARAAAKSRPVSKRSKRR
jgi:hypothetical protein